METNKVVLTGKGLQWYRTGHVWLYRDDIRRIGGAKSGDIVDVADEKGKFLGRAFYGDTSKIALRFLTRDDEPVDRPFFEKRIGEAVRRRQDILKHAQALRIIYSEGDELPGLIADKYGDWLVLQVLVPGVDRRIDMIAPILRDLLTPRGIVCRNDGSARALEGLPAEKRMLIGEKPDLVEISEGPVRYLVDVWNGHKTGAYLDQRENRAKVAAHARGRVLDCFSYQGHFALHCARTADTVIAVESSQEAVDLTRKNIAVNHAANITATAENAFDLLRRCHREKSRFDTVILDPPPLARKKVHAEDALRGYKEINLRAMHLLTPGGVLATFCCSHSIPRDVFMELLRAAAADARSAFRVREELGQPADHPVLINVPETGYLKGIILEKI